MFVKYTLQENRTIRIKISEGSFKPYYLKSKGLERIEKVDYPEEALREALLNALVHRDYSFSGSIIINVNDKGIEFISIGGLFPGLSPDDIRSGISQPRNKNIADIFQRK